MKQEENERQKPIPINKERRAALTALKTSRGQIDGIIRMIEEGRYCIDVVNQVLAAQALLKKANKLILSQHLHGCVMNAMESGNKDDLEEKTNEMISVIGKFLDT